MSLAAARSRCGCGPNKQEDCIPGTCLSAAALLALDWPTEREREQEKLKAKERIKFK